MSFIPRQLSNQRGLPAGRRIGLGACRRGGFSAVEMLVVVAILGMMALITTPAMINFWNRMAVGLAVVHPAEKQITS